MNHVTNKPLIVLFAVSVAVSLSAAVPALADIPSADEIAGNLGFPDDAKQDILNGKLVSRTLKSTNDRELAVAIVFFVSASVDELRKEAADHLLMTTDPEVIAWAPIKGDGSIDDFKTLNLDPDADKRAKAYAQAKPGDDLNLDKAEIAAFNAIKTSAVGPVTDAVKKQLLARFQAYHQKGLAGVTDYERDGGKNSPAAGDLKSASESLSGLKKALPEFYNTLLNYPNDKPKGLAEDFTWSNYKAHGEPVFILTHNFSMADQGAFVLVGRQFYVSGSYNVGQAVTAFIPVKGGTAVFYVNRTSTDQVTGFGSSTKRSMGSKVMASQLKELYEKVRDKADKDAK